MTITEEEFRHLKFKYKDAADNNKDSFRFKDEELVTSYAKYLIEHIENQPQFMKEKQ